MITEVSITDLLSGRVRLEFGNAGQLTAIKNYEKRIEEAAKMCSICNGEGSIPCVACDGSGEIKT